MFSFDNLKKKAKARRSQRPATPPSPGSFFTSPRSPRWATRSTSSDASSSFIPPVPSIPPPLPDVITISAPVPPPPRQQHSLPYQHQHQLPTPFVETRRPSVTTPAPMDHKLDLDFHPGASSSSLTDWFSTAMPPTSATPPKPVHTHQKSASISVRSNAPSDVLSPNSLFSSPSTVGSSPSTTVAGSFPSAGASGFSLGKEARRFNASDPILPSFDAKTAGSSRRAGAVPAPIKIPDGALHYPAVQVDRSVSPAAPATAASSKAVAGPPPEQTTPPSPGSTHDAILGSAFVLNGDRANEPVWNGAGLTRMDSATLPRDSYIPGGSKLRGPRPIRTNSRRQSIGLRRSASATAVIPSTPVSGSTSASSSSTVSHPYNARISNNTSPPYASSDRSVMPTVVLERADGAKRRISAITEISSAGSVYSFPDESADNLRPEQASKDTLPTLPSLTTGPSVESLVSDIVTEDERDRSAVPSRSGSTDDRPVLDQMWEFLHPNGSSASGTPRTNSTTPPMLESRPSPQSRSTASSSPSPRTRHQKPTMLNLQDPPRRVSTKQKGFEVVLDSSPESSEFVSQPSAVGSTKGKGKEPAASVPHTALVDEMFSPGLAARAAQPAQPLHQRSTSASTINTVTGAQSGHSGHSSTGSTGPGVLYVSFKKDPPLSNAGALFPETPRSFDHGFSPSATNQMFTVEVTPVHKSRSRLQTLPIGPRTGASAGGAGVLPHIRTDGVTRDMSGSGRMHAKRPSTRIPLPPSPKFTSAPVRWKGLTYDAARWTLSSEQLQEIVARAIKNSAESSSIRLLQPDIVELELPSEIENLTRQREELRSRLKQQIRVRRLLLRKLTSGSPQELLTPQGVAKNMSEIMEACALCDQLSEELFHVTDQIAQITRLRDVHQASALSMALRKINSSFVRVTSEAVELQKRISTLEAEREEAWHTAESVENELNDLRARVAKQTANKPEDDDGVLTDEAYSRPSSRVSAARKTSMRASKASLRLSTRKSRTSVASSRIFTPDSADEVPPVPQLPLTTSPLAALTDFHNSIGKARQSVGANSFVSSIVSPSPEARALAVAQAELLELLGISLSDINNANRSSSGSSGRHRRARSASDAGLHPQPSPGLLDAPAPFSPQPSPRWTVAAASPIVDVFSKRLRRSASEYASKRITAPRPDSMLLSPPRDGAFPSRTSSRGVFEDPDSLLALMTRAASSNESSPLPGHTFAAKPPGRTYI